MTTKAMRDLKRLMDHPRIVAITVKIGQDAMTFDMWDEKTMTGYFMRGDVQKAYRLPTRVLAQLMEDK